MTAQSPARCGAIALVEPDRCGQQCWRRWIEVEAEPTRAIRNSVCREPSEVKSRGRFHCARLEKLCNDVPYESVVRMTVAALRPPSDHRVRPQLAQDCFEPLRQTVKRFSRPRADDRQPGVFKAEQNWRLNSELARRAAHLTRAYGGETVTCGDSSVLRHSFPSIRGNNDIHACALAGIMRKYRRDYRLVIGVRDHCNECPPLRRT